ncbi:MAG: hypothetical protein ACLFU9_04235 [Candidatus Bathyarchaeia archaeon]
MLEHYRNFPKIIHGAAYFSYKASSKKVQQTLVTTLYKLNKKKCKLDEIAYSSAPNCEVDFEFGVGEALNFTFLDSNELQSFEKKIARRTLPWIDLLCVLQYHIIKFRKRSALKFDYFILRFVFRRNSMDFLVSHERGPQHVYVKDLMKFLTEHFKRELADLHSIALKLEKRYTV